MRLHKQLVGGGVLSSSGDEGSGVLVYAHCGRAGNGSVVIMAANPSPESASLVIAGAGQATVPTTPRLEYVLTAPGNDLSTTTPALNGGPALRINADGSLPPLPPVWVPSGGAQALVLPPQSQAFFVLLGAGSSACM